MPLTLSLLGATFLVGVIASAQSTPEGIDRLLSEAARLASQQVRRADAALPLYRQAIAMAERDGDRTRAAKGQAGLGTALWTMNQRPGAIVALNRAVDLARATGQQAVETEALRTLSAVAIDEGRYDDADRLLDAAVRAAERNAAPDEPQILMLRARILNALSVVARRQGRLSLAKERGLAAQRLLDRAEASKASVPDQLLFQVPFNIGKSLSDAGEFSSALGYFERAFQAAERIGTKGGQWHALYDTGEWYLAQGEIERAARYHDRALALSRTMDSRDMESQSLRANGTIAEARGELDAAIQFYSSAIALMSQIGQQWAVPATLVAVARARSRAGDSAGASDAADQALAAAKAAGVALGMTQAYLEIGRQALGRSALPEADTAYRAGLALAKQAGIKPLVSSALAGLGQVARRRGDLEAAAARYRESADVIAAVRGHVVAMDLRAAFAETTHDTYVSLIDVLLELHQRRPAEGHDRAAFLTVEQERSQNLIDALNGQEVDRSRELPPAARDRQRLLQSTVAGLQTRLLSDAAPANRAELLARLDDAERTLAALETEARQRGYFGQWYPSEGLADLRRVIAADEVMIAYAEAGSRLVAFLVSRDAFDVVELPRRAGLADRVDFFNRLLIAGHADEAVTVGRDLASAFLDPVLERLPGGVRRLLFAVAGPTAAVPFAALPLPKTGATARLQPLLHRYEVAYVPSLAALHHLRRQSRVESGRDLLAFADPVSKAGPGSLPYSQREVRTVAQLAGRSSTVLLGAAASEAALKSVDLSDYRVLHFATHALVDARLPSRSALVLGPSANEDGLLQPSEIYGLTLDSELIVLSACRSAGGRASAAEGVLSLARAFMYAGGRAVVGNQWDVDDRSSARLIARFYDGLSRGEPAAAALRDAQLALAGRAPYVTAAHWAGFVVSGDPLADPAFQVRARPDHGRLAATVAGTILGIVGLTTAFVMRRSRGEQTGQRTGS